MALPASLLLVLQVTRPCFTKHSFETFCHLAAGMVAQTGRRTVTGMLTGAELSRLWPHRRAHAFFSRASWYPDRLGLRLARGVVKALLPVDVPVPVVIDDTLLHRVGKKVFGVLWAHDGSGRGKDKLKFGNTWVICAVVVRLPFPTKPIALPVAARLWRGKGTASRTDLALEMVHDLAALFLDRPSTSPATPPTTPARSPTCPEPSPSPPGCHAGCPRPLSPNFGFARHQDSGMPSAVVTR
ncbi:transposase [Streptomyces sp. JNUCC 63]